MADTTERKWTAGQDAAINIRNKTLLVSAAAGSGKTATLTERIIRSLTDKNSPSDISKMLIVTFTRAAANELKERIFAALGKALAADPTSKHLNEQLIKLGSANICTIDSFYFNLIRQNFTTLGISASVRIADTAELNVLKRSVMEDVIDVFYDSDKDFSSFAECFVGTKSINNLAEPILKLFDDIISYPEGLEFLTENADRLCAYADQSADFFDTSYGRLTRAELISKFEYYCLVLNNAYEYSVKNSPAFDKRALTYDVDRAFANTVYSALKENNASFEEMRSIFLAFNPPDLGSAKKADETEESVYYKNIRKDIKEDIKDIAARIFSRDTEALCLEMRETAGYVRKLYAILTEFERRMEREKTKRNILDFDDVRRLTFKLLVEPDGTPTEIAKKYREQFTDIYIDEYQDVDKVQDMIFRAIAKNNRFMVGDIKQSIYGFRGADPQVFSDYRQSFTNYDAEKKLPVPVDKDELTVFMSDNFRCDESIIDFTNLVCGSIFASCKKTIGYTKDDDLHFSKLLPSKDYLSKKVEVDVILTKKAEDEESEDEAPKGRKKKKDDEPTADELEAEFIADKIYSLIGKEKNANGKLIVPGDIAILYRSNAMVAYLSDALRRRGILCSEGGGDEYFENPDVLLVLSLLNTVDNPHRDIHLAATLMSPLFEFTMDELITIRLDATASFSLYDALVEYSERNDPLAKKCKRFEETLTELSESSVALPVDRFLRLLFESDFFAASGLLADRSDYGEGGNLLRLYDYARTFESGSFKGLYNFIEFLNDLIENEQKLEVTQKDKSPDRVNLTTIHHSKGLEFPVCFICGTGRRKNMTEIHKNSMLYEYPEGLSLKISDTTGFARINNPLRDAIAKKKFIRENEEEMRILYVAMTRARERLYITATSKKSEEELLTSIRMKRENLCEYSIKHCMSFLEWILLPFGDPSDLPKCATLDFICADEEAFGATNEKASTEGTTVTEVTPDKELFELLKDKFSFSYGHGELSKLPAKLSVSRLSPDILDENDRSADVFDTEQKTIVPDFFISGKISRASAAERGTATHLFLQFCDFDRAASKGIDEEIARLTEKKFIPENVANLIYKKELEHFITGELASRIRSADRVIREQRFNLLLPAEAFTADAVLMEKISGETLAVQGVIDLILINAEGEIELYDYKTDRLTPEELGSHELAAAKMNERHGLQLSYYAHAVSELFGKPCHRICVYSTHASRLYDIDVVPLRLKTI